MPAPQRTTSIYNTADVPLSAATEAVVATLGGISTQAADNVVRLMGWCQLTNAAGVTSATLRVRRASLTGALVGELVAPTTGASQVWTINIDAEDSPGDVAGMPYVLTVTVAGGTGTSNTAELLAIVG